MKIEDPSKFDRRIQLQSKTLVADGMGSFTETWSTYATVWAKKTTHRSDEAVQSMKQTGRAVHNFRIRHRSDVTSAHRVLEGTTYMAIIGPPIEIIQGGGGLRYLDITVEESI